MLPDALGRGSISCPRLSPAAVGSQRRGAGSAARHHQLPSPCGGGETDRRREKNRRRSAGCRHALARPAIDAWRGKKLLVQPWRRPVPTRGSTALWAQPDRASVKRGSRRPASDGGGRDRVLVRRL